MSDSLARRIQGLSPEKRALLEQHLLRGHGGTPAEDDDAIPRRQPDEPAPLSFSQFRLWFLDQWAPGDPTYNAGLAFRLAGSVDRMRLRAAVERVIDRHEAVRTVFRAVDGVPRQVVLDQWSFDLPEADLSSLPEPARSLELAERLRRESRRPFDLAADLMLRATLFRLGPDEAVLLLVEHHIAFDGWSDSILFAEVAEVYAALGAGREPRLTPLPVQYADFALWQRRRLTGPRLDRLTDYWRRQLAGAPPVLTLPTDRPRPATMSFEGGHHHFALEPGVASGVTELGREEATTAYMTLLAAFAATLHAWAGCADLCIGTPIAGRGRVELEPLIGFFSNTLVLRVLVDGELSFRQLLGRVKETALGAYEHQELPFEKVVETVAPPRSPQHNPLFQVNFRVQAAPAEPLQLPAVEVTSLDTDVGFARFDLALELQLRPPGLAGYVEYNQALFDRATAVAFAGRFERLLSAALACPDAPIRTLGDASSGRRDPSEGIAGFRRRRT